MKSSLCVMVVVMMWYWCCDASISCEQETARLSYVSITVSTSTDIEDKHVTLLLTESIQKYFTRSFVNKIVLLITDTLQICIVSLEEVEMRIKSQCKPISRGGVLQNWPSSCQSEYQELIHWPATHATYCRHGEIVSTFPADLLTLVSSR